MKRRHRHLLVGLLVIAVVIGGAVGAKHALHSTTTISNTPSVTRTVSVKTLPLHQFDEGIFTLSLPSDWKLTGQPGPSTPGTYSWAGTGQESAHQLLTVYVDAVPATLGVNRAVLVQANDDSLSVAGDVSDNCAGFTGASPGVPSISTPAKWQGQPFLCDLGNYERDVVGTVSSDGINKVELTGATAGRHAFFFTYTDNNIEPDFGVFTAALQSFRLK